MELIPFALFAFKCGAHLVWKIQKQEVLQKLERSDNIADRDFRTLILSEFDKVDLKLTKQSRKDLLTSTMFYREGLGNLSQVLSNARRGNMFSASAVEKSNSSFDADMLDFVDAVTGDLKGLDLDERAQKLLYQALKSFDKASTKATEAFSNESLKTSERIQAMSICIMAKILENVEDPSIATSSCETFLRELHSLSDVQNTFRRAISGKGTDCEIFLPVCHLNRIVFDIIQLVSRKKGPWNWPCITVKDGKIFHRIDPLRDVRVAEALSQLHQKKEETMLINVTELPVAWSFGTEDAKLISPRDVATNTQGHFIVADNGDHYVKVFDESGKFVLSFLPLPRHLADEDIFSVASDREDNIFVLTKIDKYHYKAYLFDKHGHPLRRFPLEECFVHCSPIVTDNNEYLVLAERIYPKCSAVQVYNTDGDFVNSFGQDILEEPKDMTVTNDGHIMVLNNNGRVVVFDAEGNHLSNLAFVHADEAPVEAIAFHSESNHVVVSNLEPGFRVKLSIYNERRDCVLNIYQGGENMDENEQKECIPPKISVAKNGNIAVLAGIVGDYKVIVV